ncbi:hypothetical protein [Sphingobacterium multivorum]|uniref:Uncharacterized protein n=1 Tax=Sphingobacterium multivorum TaxID=28454 RepID=A0A654DFY0_SPHMU|nr:hypothetical protein [Sphingobacterium multivorum]QQT45470.1 hypothetical protein I6J00_01915 [Sphingobacterium multivorum]SUJ26233.1 Uncharacterised protein [Sphingobacterium multivorum]VXD04482.1 conserved exported hypothetical protein [Sphingobacterium multivorum]HBW80558.1 hypothetical protein [Sphingobacterium sp.]
MVRIKKYGKLLLGVATISGAILTQSFTEQAATNKKLAGIHRYYNKTGSPSTNPADYIYGDEDGLDCQPNDSKVCTSEWNLGSANPVVGQAPPSTATFVPNSDQKGEYTPN